jgi:DNA-binding beta-propeller fold protein YncE
VPRAQADGYGDRMATAIRWICALSVLVAVAAATAGAASLPLKQVARVGLPGPGVRFDYVSIDPGPRRLYIAHMDASELLVFDLRTRSVIRTIHAPGVHGVLAVPQLQRVFASATDDHELLTLDARSGRLLHHAPAGSYPDGIAYDPVEQHVYVSDESGGIEAVFDGQGRRIDTVQLGGEAGNVQYDAGSGRILADVQTQDEVAVIDPRTNRVVRRIATPGCDHPHGLLLDVARRLGFVACDGNATLLTLDLKELRFTGHAGVGGNPDVLSLDPGLHRLYVAAETGEVAVFAEGLHSLTTLGQSYLAPEAHSVAVDSRTHLAYFPLQGDAHHGPELLIMAPA